MEDWRCARALTQIAPCVGMIIRSELSQVFYVGVTPRAAELAGTNNVKRPLNELSRSRCGPI